MTKKGPTPTLLSEVWDHWPIESVPRLPDGLKGLYVLYDPKGIPVRVGISGRAGQDVKQRMVRSYYAQKHWRNVDTFSVFTFFRPRYFKQIETLILRAVGPALAGNENAGSFMKKTKVHQPKYHRYPEHFFSRQVSAEGKVTVPTKYGGRRVRIEIGPQADR